MPGTRNDLAVTAVGAPLAVLFAVACLLPLSRLVAAELPGGPILCIETGFHTARITSVDASADGRVVLSVSEDKTLRTWKWDGQQLEAEAVYRVPIGSGNAGQLYTGAISPDGRWLVAGGWMGGDTERPSACFIIDRRSGQLARRLGDLPAWITCLRVAPASDAVLVCQEDGVVRCLGLPEGQERWRDDIPGTVCHEACWLPDGGCVTTCSDGRIRRYDAQGRLAIAVEAPHGKVPSGLDEQGGVVAVGYADCDAISLLRAETLAVVVEGAGRLDTSGLDGGHLSSVCAAHGRWWAGGGAGTGVGYAVVSWPFEAGPREQSDEWSNTILGLRKLPGGVLVATGAPSLSVMAVDGGTLASMESQAWGFIGELLGDARGQRIFSQEGLLLDLASGTLSQAEQRQGMWLGCAARPRSPEAASGLAWNLLTVEPRDPTTAEELARAALAMPEGECGDIRDTWAEALFQLGRVAEALDVEEEVVRTAKAEQPAVDASSLAVYVERRDKIAAALKAPAPAPAAIPPRQEAYRVGEPFAAATVTAPGLVITDMDSAPSLNGRPLPLDNTSDFVNAVAIPPSAQLVVVAYKDSLRALAADGTLIWRRDMAGMPLHLTCPSKAPVAVVSCADGTLRWHRLSDGVEVLACFVHADGRRWVAWTPSGYYWAGSGGEELIGWHLNRGRDELADFYPASRFRERFNRPDIVQAVFETWDEAKAIALVGQTRRVDTTDLATTLPPVVEILAPAEGERLSTAQLTLSLHLRSAADAPVTGLRVLYDGQELAAERGLRPVAAAGSTTLSLTLPAHSGLLSVVADNRHGASVPATRQVVWAGAASVIKPACYVLAVGVGGYRNQGIEHLRFPVADAQAVAGGFKQQEGRLFREVQVQVIADGDRLAVMKGLSWLKKSCTNQDLAVLFLAGHGENDDQGAYHFLPVDSDPGDLAATAVPFTAIMSTIQAIPGKRLAFLDTCRAGNVTGGLRRRGGGNATDQALNQLASAENGCVVFAAATGRQAALEQDSWGHGAFTLALTEALGGNVPGEASLLLKQILAEPSLSVNMLNVYVAERVKQLTNGQQSPTMERPATVPDFPIAVRP